jgi:RNA polymerase sigma factor (sigma-70 family)
MPSPTTVLLRTQSDERLVALARGGHDRAFEAIVERYRRQLLRACRRILPEARAEDALQQALLAAWAGLRRGDDVVELRPWLFRIVRNTALNQLRVSGYDLDELVETLSATDDPEDEVVRRAVVRQTLAAVASLPERQREALLRTAIEGEPQSEVARDLGLTSTAMRQLVHRARVSVRATATALVPMPVATWLASAGGATATATLAKAGTLVVIAGGAVGGTALVEGRPPGAHHRDQAVAAAPRERDRDRVATPAETATPAATAIPTAAPEREAAATRKTFASTQRRERRDDREERDDTRGHDRGDRDDTHGNDRGDRDDEPIFEPRDDREEDDRAERGHDDDSHDGFRGDSLGSRDESHESRDDDVLEPPATGDEPDDDEDSHDSSGPGDGESQDDESHD